MALVRNRTATPQSKRSVLTQVMYAFVGDVYLKCTAEVFTDKSKDVLIRERFVDGRIESKVLIPRKQYDAMSLARW